MNLIAAIYILTVATTSSGYTEINRFDTEWKCAASLGYLAHLAETNGAEVASDPVRMDDGRISVIYSGLDAEGETQFLVISCDPETI